jgi:hypothetical protein
MLLSFLIIFETLGDYADVACLVDGLKANATFYCIFMFIHAM